MAHLLQVTGLIGVPVVVAIVAAAGELTRAVRIGNES